MRMKNTLILLMLIYFSMSECQNYLRTADLYYIPGSSNVRQMMDIYVPDDAQGSLPCVVWIHGGAWKFGSKGRLPQMIEALLYHDYVVADINYRLSGDSVFPAQILDCMNAIRYLKYNCAKYSIDSSRIGVAGESAGGHLVALLGTSAGNSFSANDGAYYTGVSSSVQAVVDFYGPTDFLIMDRYVPKQPPDSCGATDPHDAPDSPESLLLGCPVTECTDRVHQANPITYITPDDPPFLIFHGMFDCVVTPQSSIILDKALKDAGVETELVLVPHASHGLRDFTNKEVESKILTFFNRYLKNCPSRGF